MRLSELLDSEVIDRNGERVGHVHDVRLIQDGPSIGAWGPALRLEAIAVGRSAIGKRLGVTSPRMKGPWILKVLFARQRSSRVLVPWTRVRSIGDGRVNVDCVAAECQEADTEDAERFP
jgi:sporulation protein YlmC with PRC-barrel domain